MTNPLTTSTFHVTGMTCGHCVRSVTESVLEVPLVTDVGVDLSTGIVTVTSDSPVDASLVAAAISEAGYELAS